ncbi:MAG: hypothetical protein FJ098_13335 [Deltaproteobacteria bacterium]|nr:hypothetical protein [Deltaproteobacteria bacterium]
MRRILSATILLGVLAPAPAQATAQMGDILIYNGEKLEIFSNPLEAWFGAEHPRPEDLSDASCSANWRGYVATWEIRDRALWLVRLQEGTCDVDAPEIPLDRVFPGEKGPIRATWYTGVLIAPRGKLLEYVHMGYESRYEKELRIEIQAGEVKGERTVENGPTPPPPPEPPPAPKP